MIVSRRHHSVRPILFFLLHNLFVIISFASLCVISLVGLGIAGIAIPAPGAFYRIAEKLLF